MVNPLTPPTEKPDLTWKPYWEESYLSRIDIFWGWFAFLIITPLFILSALVGCIFSLSILTVFSPDRFPLILLPGISILGVIIGCISLSIVFLCIQAPGIKFFPRKTEVIEIHPYGRGLHFKQYWFRSPHCRRGIIVFGSRILGYRKRLFVRRYDCVYVRWKDITSIDYWLLGNYRLPSECRVDFYWRGDQSPGTKTPDPATYTITPSLTEVGMHSTPLPRGLFWLVKRLRRYQILPDFYHAEPNTLALIIDTLHRESYYREHFEEIITAYPTLTPPRRERLRIAAQLSPIW